MSNPKEEAVKKFLDHFHTKTLNVEGLRASLAPNARYQSIVPFAKTVQGADTIISEMERQFKLYEDCKCEMLNIATNGSVVFTERVDSVRMLHDGKVVLTRVAGIFDLDDQNRITFWREYWDSLDLADQIGVSGEVFKTMMQAS
jgi:limonene-1,2-epoxide hydrolase